MFLKKSDSQLMLMILKRSNRHVRLVCKKCKVLTVQQYSKPVMVFIEINTLPVHAEINIISM